jgi:membrane-associated phospholipid phosphatase
VGVVGVTMLSRIELGKHWPIDTVAGLLVGIIGARLLVMLYHWLTGPQSRRDPFQIGG